MVFNVHGGHAAAGNLYCGAVGLIDESVEDRLVANEIIRLLKLNGHTAYNCTVDSGTSQTNVLKKICDKCNAHTVNMDISIHFNSGRSDYKGDHKVGGFEVWCTNTNKGKGLMAEHIRKEMANIGFTDRGTKTASNLYFLNHTVSPAILLEVAFVDDKDDVDLYLKLGYKEIAIAIVKGILGQSSIISDKNYLATFPKLPVGNRKYYQKGDGMDGGLCTAYDITQIKYIQKFLNWTGIKDADGNKLTTDGKYGACTAYCVGQFQKKVGLKVNKQWGEKTLAEAKKYEK